MRRSKLWWGRPSACAGPVVPHGGAKPRRRAQPCPTSMFGVAVLLVFALTLTADVRGVPRAKIANAEKLIDTQLASMYPDEPWFLLGPTNGVYLDGFGAVFSAQINLATGPTSTPFKLEISKEEIARHRDKKITRLPDLRKMMLKIVGSTGGYLDNLAPSEQFVLSVTLLRYPYEDPKSAPSQIVMQVEHGKLVDAQKRGAPLDSIVKVTEY